MSEPDDLAIGPAELFANARTAKALRERALVDVLVSRSSSAEPAPEAQRVPAGDGSARRMRTRHAETHDELIVRLARLARTYGGEHVVHLPRL